MLLNASCNALASSTENLGLSGASPIGVTDKHSFGLSAPPVNVLLDTDIGFSTNLARLLESQADSTSALTGRELVAGKVKFLSIMGGSFRDVLWDGKRYAKGSPDLEFNLKLDVSAAQKVFSYWPTPIVASGAEIGVEMLYPGRSIALDYSYVDHHPIADSYRTFCEEEFPRGNSVTKMTCPEADNHPTSDLTSVLYAARPHRDYFSLSKPGKITLMDDSSAHFEESASGNHRYLILSELQKARTLEAMVMLASQPPTHVR